MDSDFSTYTRALQAECVWRVQDRAGFEAVAMGISRFKPERIVQS